MICQKEACIEIAKIMLKQKNEEEKNFWFFCSKLCLQSGNLLFLLESYILNKTEKDRILKSLNFWVKFCKLPHNNNNYDIMRLPKMHKLEKNYF